MPSVDDYTQQEDGTWKLNPLLTDEQRVSLQVLPSWIKEGEAAYERALSESRFKGAAKILNLLGHCKKLLKILRDLSGPPEGGRE